MRLGVEMIDIGAKYVHLLVTSRCSLADESVRVGELFAHRRIPLPIDVVPLAHPISLCANPPLSNQ